MDEGSGTSPIGRLYDPPIYDMLYIELDTLSDRKQQDRLIPCDNGEVKAWFQGDTNKIVLSLWDQLESGHETSGHLGCGRVSFPHTSTVYKDVYHHLIVSVLKKGPIGFVVIID